MRRTSLLAAPLLLVAGCSVFIEFDEDKYRNGDGDIFAPGGADSGGTGGFGTSSPDGGSASGGEVSTGGGGTGGGSGGTGSTGGDGSGGGLLVVTTAEDAKHYYALDDADNNTSAMDDGPMATRQVGRVNSLAEWGPGGVKNRALTLPPGAFLELPRGILPHNSFTLSFFMASTNGDDSYRNVLTTVDPTNQNDKRLFLSQDKSMLRLTLGGLSWDIENAIPLSGQGWAHITLSFARFAVDGTKDRVSVYVDGVQVFTHAQTFTSESPYTDDELYFGENSAPAVGGGAFVGRLDEIRIFEEELNTAEVAALYEFEAASL